MSIRLTCFLLVALWGAPDPAIEAALEALQEAEDGARAPTDASGSPEAKRRYTTGKVVPTAATSTAVSGLSVRTHVGGKDNGDGDDDDSHDKYHALMT